MFLVIAWVLIVHLVEPVVQQQQFELDVILEEDGKQIQCHGFLDTGNSLHYHHLPVVFLSKRFSDLSSSIQGKTITFTTVSNEEYCMIYPCTVMINEVRKPAYFALSDQMSLSIDCLLNPKLFH